MSDDYPGVRELASVMREVQVRFQLASISATVAVPTDNLLRLTIYGLGTAPLMAIEDIAGNVQMVKPEFVP